MLLEIVTPEEKKFSGNAKLVQLPGSNGSFEIMENHAPMISSLTKGKLKIVKPEGELVFFDIDGGVVEVSKNKVIVLAGSM